MTEVNKLNVVKYLFIRECDDSDFEIVFVDADSAIGVFKKLVLNKAFRELIAERTGIMTLAQSVECGFGGDKKFYIDSTWRMFFEFDIVGADSPFLSCVYAKLRQLGFSLDIEKLGNGGN